MSESMDPVDGSFGHAPSMAPSVRRSANVDGPRESGVQPLHIGPYRIDGTLGRGGFGTVHRALDTRSGVAVALKVLHREVAADPNMLRRFLREAQTTSAADNPHVVRALDMHEDLDGHACIAFELLTGETLEARLRREGVLSPHEAVDFAIQILDGLEVAHERGIVHRDVKPANLFLVADELRTPCVKILDFGIGRLAYAEGTKLTETGASMGSPFYMAPEQAFDSSSADARADLFGTAVCLYRMLSGRLPHGDGPASAWLTFIAQGQLAPRVSSPHGDLPAPLVEAVALGLSPRPEARWQNATAFSSALLDSLPGASAPTRVSYEPAAVLRAPMPDPDAPSPGRSGRHAAIAMPIVLAEPRVEPPRSRPVAPTLASPAMVSGAFAPAPATLAPAPTTPSRRALWIALAVGVIFTLLAILIGGVGLAYLLGEAAGRQSGGGQSGGGPIGLPILGSSR